MSQTVKFCFVVWQPEVSLNVVLLKLSMYVEYATDEEVLD